MLAEEQTNSSIPPNDEKWDLIIRPQRKLLDLRLGDLIRLFVWRDFVSVSSRRSLACCGT